MMISKDDGNNVEMIRRKTKGIKGYQKVMRRVGKGVHRGLLVTRKEEGSYPEIAKSLCVEPNGPK